ncbi:hypothetical protein SGPA1_31427 [Streptomyces misionensis JCM 4497]
MSHTLLASTDTASGLWTTPVPRRADRYVPAPGPEGAARGRPPADEGRGPASRRCDRSPGVVGC